jgi:hypothetical protein
MQKRACLLDGYSAVSNGVPHEIFSSKKNKLDFYCFIRQAKKAFPTILSHEKNKFILILAKKSPTKKTTVLRFCILLYLITQPDFIVKKERWKCILTRKIKKMCRVSERIIDLSCRRLKLITSKIIIKKYVKYLKRVKSIKSMLSTRWDL